MEREERYIVIKMSDIEYAMDRHIDSLDLSNLKDIVKQIEKGRVEQGKQPLQAVVVEHDWPEYEPTWKAIEERVTLEQWYGKINARDYKQGQDNAAKHWLKNKSIYFIKGISPYCNGWNSYAREVLDES